MSADAHVKLVTAERTHDLRRRILRAGTPSTELDWPRDHDHDTVHLAVQIDSLIVAISTWLRADCPEWTGQPGGGVQIRGMATDDDPGVRGHGYGTRLLVAGLERAKSAGANHVWANARSNVVDFYTSHGFRVVSDEFMDAATAIPHRRIIVDVH